MSGEETAPEETPAEAPEEVPAEAPEEAPAESEGDGGDEESPEMPGGEEGFVGEAIDPTPNDNYTVEGVTSGAPTPETDEAAAEAVAERRKELRV